MARRVLLVIPYYVPAWRYGGPVLSTHALAVALLRSGWSVTVATSDADGSDRLDVPRHAVVDGVSVHYLRRIGREFIVPALAPRVVELARSADVVHIAPIFNWCTLLSLTAMLVRPRPVVLSPRGALEPWAIRHKQLKKRTGLMALAPLLRTVDALHATSPLEQEACQRVLPRIPAVVVPNGTDVPAEPPEPVPAGVPVITALGRLHPIKGLDRLIAACGLLRDRGLSFRVVLAGPDEGGYGSTLRLLARSHHLEDAIEFPGLVRGDKKWDLLRASRLVALPSHSENFGNVVLEALASGRPVVASRGTPWGELEAHRCGRWVGNDPHTLADAMEPYLREPDLATGDGFRGRAHVAERYTWDMVAQRMAALYDQAIARHLSRRA